MAQRRGYFPVTFLRIGSQVLHALYFGPETETKAEQIETKLWTVLREESSESSPGILISVMKNEAQNKCLGAIRNLICELSLTNS